MEEDKNIHLHQRINAIVTVLLILAVAICLYATIQVLSNGYVNIGGFMMFRVVTGSMEPTIPVGSLLLTHEVDIESIRLDDIICFRTQVSEIWGKIVTHRVVGIEESVSGGILLETKGDANLVSDIYYVDQSNFVGKVVWHTGDGSILAEALSLFTSKIGFLGFIVMPCLLIVGLILKNSVGSIRQELQVVLEMERNQQQKDENEEDLLCGMTREEYDEMYERIRSELMEELINFEEIELGTENAPEISEKE